MRPRLLAVIALVASAALLAGLPAMSSVAVTPGAGVGPEPGPANPWLHRRFLAAAHAGGEDEAPHSTLYAFGQAKAEGVHILDTDMQLTKDGVPVIIHNDTVDRTTNGTGPVADLTYAQVHALDAGYWYTNDCWACTGRPEADYVWRGVRTGQKPPPAGYTADDFAVSSYRELFQRYPEMIIDIEIKGSYPAQIPAARALADLIHEFGRAAKTVVTSFDDQLLDAFKQMAPDVATSAGRQGVTDFFTGRKPLPGQQILDVPPFYDLGGTRIEVVTKQFVDDAHANGMAVWVWMDSGDEENATFYGHLIDLGVDGILAARPSVLMGVVRARGIGWDGVDPPLPSTTTSTSTTAIPSTTSPSKTSPTTTSPTSTSPTSTPAASTPPTSTPAASTPPIASPPMSSEPAPAVDAVPHYTG